MNIDSTPNRRILVSVFDERSSPSLGRKKRKCAITVPSTSSNAKLLDEIATTFNISRESISLEVGDGFELRLQDPIDTIAAGDIVTARIIDSSASNTTFSATPVHSGTMSSTVSGSSVISDISSFISSISTKFHRNSTQRQRRGSASQRSSSIPTPSTPANLSVIQSLPESESVSAYMEPLITDSATLLDSTQSDLTRSPKTPKFKRKILFVTAEMAWQYARSHPNDVRVDDLTLENIGVLAFGGSYVSGNTTLGAIKAEAHRVLNLPVRSTGSEFMALDDDCSCKGSGGTNCEVCSCALAEEIEQHGIISTMHCRLSLNNSKCPHGDLCPYSHIKLDTPNLQKHCSVCEDALSLPCPKCKRDFLSTTMNPGDPIYCPLVSNSGCGHLHHAHCLNLHLSSESSRVSTPQSSSAPCPSGCSYLKFPREQLNFDLLHKHSTSLHGPSTLGSSGVGQDQAYITIAWHGDKIDYIPIPERLFVSSRVSQQSIPVKTESIVELVREFLIGEGYVIPGLMVRLHQRDPVTEEVRLTQWTLVSVCASSAHAERSVRWFELFSSATASVPASVSPQMAPKSEERSFDPWHAQGAPEIDLHTSSYPILTCDCTPFSTLFPSELLSAQSTGYMSSSAVLSSDQNSLVLFVVPRTTVTMDPSSLTNTKPTGKATTFFNGPAWHPHEAQQTLRGIAALLSSLYVLAESVAHSAGNKMTVMRNVLAMMWMITGFPPAVRSLALIIENLNLIPQEKAAFASSLYHALKGFAHQAPKVIIDNPSRIFETSRILLGQILPPADAPLFALSSLSRGDLSDLSASESPVEYVPLTCISSRNRLLDPVLFEGILTERSFAELHRPGGDLYRPKSNLDASVSGLISELPSSSLVLNVIRATAISTSASNTTSRTSMAILHPSQISVPPPSYAFTLESARKDFIRAIRSTNRSELVTRAPLDLKAPAIVPPQLVLDEKGFIAVFTGRGCGSTKDVNFFRPTCGGDTEVDINDVAYALDKIVPLRKAEGTWELDSFSGSEVTYRDPEEAIVLCLDLSRSMSMASGIGNSPQNRPREEADVREAEEDRCIHELIYEYDAAERLHRAKLILNQHHWTTHHAWKAYVDFVAAKPNGHSFSLSQHRQQASMELLEELRITARRDLHEDPRASTLSDERVDENQNLACFAWACSKRKDIMADYLKEIVSESNVDSKELVGGEVFGIPRGFMDPKTGDILVRPRVPNNAPSNIYVSQSSLNWFESLENWPKGPFVEHYLSSLQLQNAIAKWVSGEDLQAPQQMNIKGKVVYVTLFHDGKSTTWRLLATTTTRKLYSLASRATNAKYDSFMLKVKSVWPGNMIMSMSDNVTLASTELAKGGTIELQYARPHTRESYVFTVHKSRSNIARTLLLPREVTVIALCYYAHVVFRPPSDLAVWYNLHDAGDKHRLGSVFHSTIRGDHVSMHIRTPDVHELEFDMRQDEPTQKEESRHLTRLHLMQELFNVFLNRVCSFDTSIPLVLGLVTFSDQAQIAQELTPLFEKFGETLAKVEADGDTALYDALDVARSMLVNYRHDLPTLRKRIIMVSDGQDTVSKTSVVEVCAKLQQEKIIVDSVQVGPSANQLLHGISVATGGYRFCPQTSLTDALSIFDLETVLNSGERPKIVSKAHVSDLWTLRSVYGDQRRFPTDVVTIDQFPKRADHARLHESAVPIASANISTRMLLTKDNRIKCIMLEIRNLVAKAEDQMDIYIDEKDMTFFRIIMEAPKNNDCLYRDGVYQLTCEFPAGYPRDPPQIRFVNFIMHPNVSKQGKVCIAELGRLWSSETSMVTVLQLVYQIFSHPDLENPLETQASMKYYDDDGSYAYAVAEAVKAHASKTREQWRSELECL